MSNQHLSQDIFKIVQKLSVEEVNQFIEGNKNKKSGDKKYLKLFEEYIKQLDEIEIVVQPLKAKFPNTLNDLNQNLRDKLYEFLKSNYVNKEDKKASIEKLKEKILTGKALMEKNLFFLAEKEIKPAFELAKELYSNTRLNKDYFLGYVLEVYFLLSELHYKNAKNNLWNDEKDFYDSIIRPTVQTANMIYGEIFTNVNQNETKYLQENYVYHEVIKTFYREQKSYEQLNEILFTDVQNIFKDIQEKEDSEANDFLEIPNLLWHFERLILCLKTKKYNDFEYNFHSLVSQISLLDNPNINPYLAIIIYRELYRLAFIYSSKINKPFELLNDLSKLSKKKLNLFLETEISNTALHFHINDALTKFLMKDFKGYIKKIQDPYIKQVLINYPEYYYPMTVILLFAYRINNEREDYEKIEKIESEFDKKFLKNAVDDFYIRLKPFLKESYWSRAKTIDSEKFVALENSANELDHFHQIILSVLRKYVKTE
jgi:hypothetical protein